jgi:Tfp pilus assembly protein PilX
MAWKAATSMEPETMRPQPQRGSALIIAMIAISVLMILVVAAIQFTGVNKEASQAKLRGDELAACAENAKRMLMSQLNDPTKPIGDVVAVYADGGTSGSNAGNFTVPNEVAIADRTNLTAGHYSNTETGTSVATIIPLGSSVLGESTRNARDMSNVSARYNFGGTPYRVTMRCRDSAGREAEVEFVIKYGI